ncbi:MAG: TlyA family RNA methyltransferase [Ruminococcus sp.]|nr:TlyA family RNA methyltransferase [Ruminococcus sp.]
MPQRLDFYLVENGLFKSRERAKIMIKNGSVFVNGAAVTKPSLSVSDSDKIECCDDPIGYVGRGGLKLEHAFKAFSLDVSGKTAADIGASTGGFTECLLKHGTSKVYAVDVGHGQLDDTLKNDSRVVDLEGVNARYMTPDLFDERPSFICGDLSFISLRLVIGPIIDCLCDNGELVLLIKPQFEAGRSALNKHGIVTDIRHHIRVINELTDLFIQLGLAVIGITYSDIKGSDGNIEYLVWLRKGDSEDSITFSAEEIVSQAKAFFSKQK